MTILSEAFGSERVYCMDESGAKPKALGQWPFYRSMRSAMLPAGEYTLIARTHGGFETRIPVVIEPEKATKAMIALPW